MTPDDVNAEKDEELDRLLARWTAPIVPADMDDRVLAAFRRSAGVRRPWARFFAGTLRVPVPVALGVVLLLLVTALLALRPAPAAAPATTGSPESNEAVRSAQKVEPPVVTRPSLAGFRPVTEVTATVVRATNETRP